jgi:hypothetical protein
MRKESKTGFLRVTAICSFLGALTTTLLIFLPSTPANDFETSVQLHTNSLYLSKLWILFIHPQVNIIATFGIGLLLFKKNPFPIIAGTMFIFIWAYTEMSQQALLIDTLNQLWRPGYLSSTTDADRTIYKTLITGASGISDGKYFLVIYGFGVGSLLYGMALIREQRLGKWLGVSLLFIGLLSLGSFARYYLEASFMNGIVNWLYEWIYPYLQPLVRIGIGIWILKEMKLNHHN